MKLGWLALTFVPLAVACLPQAHFPDISDTMARKDLQCPAVGITELEPYAFRADGCGKTAFYRCSYGRNSAAHSQCCQRTKDESSATAFLAPSPPDPYCEDHFE
ncbi:hypothetical protein BH09MYX1_BH09MYX1_13620 [soil metagenome]